MLSALPSFVSNMKKEEKRRRKHCWVDVWLTVGHRLVCDVFPSTHIQPPAFDVTRNSELKAIKSVFPGGWAFLRTLCLSARRKLQTNNRVCVWLSSRPSLCRGVTHLGTTRDVAQGSSRDKAYTAGLFLFSWDSSHSVMREGAAWTLKQIHSDAVHLCRGFDDDLMGGGGHCEIRRFFLPKCSDRSYRGWMQTWTLYHKLNSWGV